jgi:6-pyruvoyltetrahydropterin/6-carboxytetrahydropterin synthase
VTLAGDVVREDGSPLNGMVMDFSEVRALARAHVVDEWDHAFIVWRGDGTVVRFLEGLPGHKTVVLDVVPTAENLALAAFRILDGVYRDSYGNHLRLERVRVYETPNCWADAVHGEV